MNLAARTVSHLDTRFLFPFSIDVEEVKAAHPEIWGAGRRWIEGLDEFVTTAALRYPQQPVIRHVGPWKRSPYVAFDLDSQGYQDLVFFHPFTRRVFFDLAGEEGMTERETLLRLYRLAVPDGVRLLYAAEDLNGNAAEVQVNSLALLLFANGIGILSLGIEAFGITTEQALWINESMRKIYPSSGRQVREGRAPWRSALVLERNSERTTIVEHDYRQGSLDRLLPPLAKTITSLLYFLDYADEDYEPVLDESMVVYSYASLDPAGLPPDFAKSEECQILLSRFLYVDRAGSEYRYEPKFIKRHMRKHLYTRWAHFGTYYGFTSYSSVTFTIGGYQCDFHRIEEGLLVHRMFASRYFIMAMIALFYRATLLDFSERVALVSKRLYLDQWFGRFHLDNIQLTGRVRAEFLHFNTHWYFDELTNKDEECEHFQMQCRQYRTEVMRQDLERELDSLNMSLHTFYQFRATEAVNRLALFSVILGCGAVVTGFFGMNFSHVFDFLLKPAPGLRWIFWGSLSFAAIVAACALWFAVWAIVVNWADYRNSILAGRGREGWAAAKRLRKTSSTSR